MREYEVKSVHVGQPKQMENYEKKIWSAIDKKATDQDIFLSYTGLEGDAQANLIHHGGPDKALCLYSEEHYSYWNDELGLDFAAAAFGENVTLQGLTEPEVHIGDVFKWGEAKIQVTQPRQPCFKLAIKHGVPEMVLKVQQTGYTGFYCRVLQEGRVSVRDRFVLERQDDGGITIALANQIMFHDKLNLDGARRILAVEALSASWRETLSKR
ncbi:MOSC domain-containing protein YiiM [Paenibacillus shirakamiensis]|uniref:MOSC domain-containing protein YiiM n=2 Tax=Paenibacillus shirakamiensis TaxID=1265935 RepID=A0ABS4JGY1_9BACL|nr:MOSC domain-containing protein YiiM [Paenibacillus shirakamiensis]